MSRSITILGSTGSIGTSAMRVLRFLKEDFSVTGLSCRGNIEELGKQIAEFSPAAVAVESREAFSSRRYRELKGDYPSVEFLEGKEGVIELATRSTDIILSAIVGAAGLEPNLAAVRAKSARRLALANKETLVMAGGLFMEEVRRAGIELIPVDSEHSAIFLLTDGLSRSEVSRIILTASGGSLRSVPVRDLEIVTPGMALDHPTWDMGQKITIDSATLMNKGFEVIEAHHLFGMDYDDIHVVIHPQSVVHSFVETVDGALYAHMGVADMALPILNALKYPEKMPNPFGRIRLEEVGMLNFMECDAERYPALDLCYSAGRRGGTMPACLNAANETAVSAFLEGKILFTDIARIVEKTISLHGQVESPALEDILAADEAARKISLRIINGETL